ncbi:MAG: phage virion morphogenesis protein [Chitinophagaceae bacterium]|nr:phage virion morphogenesis protein [Chitinophagaceae bacterium]
MSDTLTVRLDSAPVLARLQEIARRVDDLSPAMRGIGELMVESTKQRFSDGRDPDGAKWEPLSYKTIMQRIAQITNSYAAYSNLKTGKVGRVKVGNKAGMVNKDGRISKQAAGRINVKPLVDTGILQDTIRYQLTADGNGVEIGTNRFAGEWEGGAAVHQFGDKKGNIPARPFLGLSANDEREILDVLDRFMRQAIG